MEASTGDLEHQVPDDFCHETLASIGISGECINSVSKPLDAAEPVHNEVPDMNRLMHSVENHCDYFCNCDVERVVLHRVSHPETREMNHEIATMANAVTGRVGWEITEANRLMDNGDTEGRCHRLPRRGRYPRHRRPLPERA